MQDFWDLDFACNCVQGGLPYVRGLKKPEAVAALRALVGFVQLLPHAPALLQEVRALAGRRLDGLDRAGGPDHVRLALQEQRGIRPYSYTAALQASGVPQAPAPQPGQRAAHSYVPPASLPGTSLRSLVRAGEQQRQDVRALEEAAEAAEAAAALMADPSRLKTQGSAGPGADDEDTAEAAAALARDTLAMNTQAGPQDDESLLFDLGPLPTLPGVGGGPRGGGGDDGDDEEEKVSASISTDDPVRVGNVDDPGLTPPPGAVGAGNVRAPAATDPLVDAGGTLGGLRGREDQSQVQAGSQELGGSSAVRPKFKKSRICKFVRRDEHCQDKDCDKEHPPRCGDPRCFPRRRRDCPHWHDLRGLYSNPPQRPQRRGPQGLGPQGQGNATGAGPGRARQGKLQGGQRQGGGRHQQHRQLRPPPPPLPYPFWQGQQQQQRRRQDQRQRQDYPIRPPLPHWQPWAPPPPLQPLRQRQQLPQQQQQHQQPRQQEQQVRSYSEVLRGGGSSGFDPLHLLLDRLAALEEAVARTRGSVSYPGTSAI